MNENLLILAVITVLSLVPAYILYRFLPSNTIVNGPFQGLTVQLTGAFGGFFLVMLALFGFYHTLPDRTAGIGDQEWTVRGKLQTPITNLSDLQLSVRPATTQIDEDGTFVMRMLAPLNQGKPDLPTLIVQHPLYETLNVHFPVAGGPAPDCASQVNEKQHTIDVPQDCLHLVQKQAAPATAFVTNLESVPGK